MNPVFTPAMITSPQDMMIILVVALIVFGPKKLPEIGKQIGSALRELNKMRGDVQRAFELDELTKFDTTPQYHSPPYGATYPSTDSYNSVAASDGPIGDVAGSVSGHPEITGARDSATGTADWDAGRTASGESASSAAPASAPMPAPPGPASARRIAASGVTLESNVTPESNKE